MHFRDARLRLNVRASFGVEISVVEGTRSPAPLSFPAFSVPLPWTNLLVAGLPQGFFVANGPRSLIERQKVVQYVTAIPLRFLRCLFSGPCEVPGDLAHSHLCADMIQSSSPQRRGFLPGLTSAGLVLPIPPHRKAVIRDSRPPPAFGPRSRLFHQCSLLLPRPEPVLLITTPLHKTYLIFGAPLLRLFYQANSSTLFVSPSPIVEVRSRFRAYRKDAIAPNCPPYPAHLPRIVCLRLPSPQYSRLTRKSSTLNGHT